MNESGKNKSSDVLLTMIASELIRAFKPRHKLNTHTKEENAKTTTTKTQI
jgi:hypothetical protein